VVGHENVSTSDTNDELAGGEKISRDLPRHKIQNPKSKSNHHMNMNINMNIKTLFNSIEKIGALRYSTASMKSTTPSVRFTHAYYAICVLVVEILLHTPTLFASAFGCPPPERLRRLLHATDSGEAPIILLPCCYDGLTARLVGLAGFNATFMTGFGVSGANGYPDTQLVSFNEMLSAANSVAEGLSSAALELVKYGEPDQTGPPVAIPCIADGDTGYGNAINVKRTVFGYARAGMAGMMIEDQVAPKRCGHVAGKSVVPFDEAMKRVQAACDAR